MASYQHAAPRNTAFAAMAQGFCAPWAGFRFMARRPGLWRYGVMPTALNLLITLLVLAVLIATAVAFVVYLHPRFPEGAWGTVWEVLSALGILLVAVGLAVSVWVLAGGILSGYFYGKLAEAVELEFGMRPEEIHEIPFRAQVVDTLLDFGWLALANSGLLLLNCLPGVGSVLAAVLGVYVNSYVFGRDFLDYPLALRGMRRSEKHAFCRGHRWQTLGLGAAALPLGLVPVVGAIGQTAAVAGAVLLHRELAEGGARVQSGIVAGPPAIS